MSRDVVPEFSGPPFIFMHSIRRRDFYPFREWHSNSRVEKKCVVLWWFLVDYKRDKNQAINR